MTDLFDRHERIAFQFSGGRDSMAALYLLRDHWDQMTVYHLDTGDMFPESKAIVDLVALDVPIIRIQGDAHGVRQTHGWPSDLVPADNTPTGQLVSGNPLRIQGRYDCCARTLMMPMNERMVSDGIRAIIRGQRNDEFAQVPLRSGDVSDGFEMYYPIEDWDAGMVDAFLEVEGLEVAPFYEFGMKSAPACMGCTAWWNEGRLGYMQKHHPDKLEPVLQKMIFIRNEVIRQASFLGDGLGAAMSAKKE